MTTTESCFQVHWWGTWTELNPNPTFTELEPNTNLIFKKYSEPKLNRTLIIKEPDPNMNPKFWVLSHLQ